MWFWGGVIWVTSLYNGPWCEPEAPAVIGHLLMGICYCMRQCMGTGNTVGIYNVC